MVTIDEAVIARIDKANKHFEILVDSELAYEYRSGKEVSFSKILAVSAVFTDARKGLRAPVSDINAAFHSADVEAVARQILKEGDIQLTTHFRKQKLEEKRRQIAAIISKNAINPQTRLPHPIERILASMEQAGAPIDAFASATQQVDVVLKALKPVIPISIEQIRLTVFVPAKYSGRAYGALKEFGIEKDEWLADGSLRVTVSVPAGTKDDVFHKVGAITEGSAEIKEEK